MSSVCSQVNCIDGLIEKGRGATMDTVNYRDEAVAVATSCTRVVLRSGGCISMPIVVKVHL